MNTWIIFKTALRLGVTSFGGPTAHLGYFHETYVREKKWLTDGEYADLVALAQFLPGPASSQVGIGIGYLKGGVFGAIASFLGFTLPSVIALALFASVVTTSDVATSPLLLGLPLVAVAIVLHAVLGMSRTLVTTVPHALIALATFVFVLLVPSGWSSLVAILTSGLIGWLAFRTDERATSTKRLPRRSIVLLGTFVALLVAFPLLYRVLPNDWTFALNEWYRAGALVFGGGHVVLPMLEPFVTNGLLTEADFLAGYGAAQAVPGPLFTFASFLGATMAGPLGALVATIVIFVPSFLLMLGVLPVWETLRTNGAVRGMLTGVNASVVGLLWAALYTPVATSTLHGPKEVAFAATLYVLLAKAKLPAWLIVLLGVSGSLLVR